MTDLDTQLDEILVLDLLSNQERETYGISKEILANLSDLGIGTRSVLCDTKEEVLFALKQAVELANHKKFAIHFTAHGGQSGLGNNAGLRIEWSELASLLESINDALNRELLVVALACKGFYGFEMVKHALCHEPFYALMGPTRNFNAREMIETSVEFYNRLSGNPQVPEVVSDVNQHFDRDRPRIWVRSSQSAKAYNKSE